MAVSNTLSYYDTAKITAVISFKAQAPRQKRPLACTIEVLQS
jgi:hypothetical protein